MSERGDFTPKSLNFRYGAMDSGKSADLVNAAYNYRKRGLEVITAKPSTDTRDLLIRSRNGSSLELDFVAEPNDDIRQLVHREIGRRSLEIVECVITDESQFFSGEQVDQLFEVAKLDGISVIAYGLKTDFQSNLFPGSKRLLELADNIKELPTMCTCGSQARFNARKINGLFVFNGSQVAIEGDETEYEPLCGSCYLSAKQSA